MLTEKNGSYAQLTSNGHLHSNVMTMILSAYVVALHVPARKSGEREVGHVGSKLRVHVLGLFCI